MDRGPEIGRRRVIHGQDAPVRRVREDGPLPTGEVAVPQEAQSAGAEVRVALVGRAAAAIGQAVVGDQSVDRVSQTVVRDELVRDRWEGPGREVVLDRLDQTGHAYLTIWI